MCRSRYIAWRLMDETGREGKVGYSTGGAGDTRALPHAVCGCRLSAVCLPGKPRTSVAGVRPVPRVIVR
jgi:hypothetical protein